MQKASERAVGVVLILSLVALVVDALLARRTGLLSVSALLPFHYLTLTVGAFVFFRIRLARLSEEEQRDLRQASASAATSSIFAADTESEPFSISRSRDQFERFAVPAASLVLAIAQALWAWRLYRKLPWITAIPAEQFLGAAFLGAQAFFFFLASRYLLGLSRHADYRLVRGPGITTGLTCLASLIAAIGAGISSAHAPTDRFVALALLVIVGVLAIESALRFLVALYSPRRKGAVNTSYESKLGGLLTDPAGWARSVAQSLDYQFGYKVSETGFYRFFRSAIVPLLVFQGTLLYAMSAFVFLGPEEEAVLERFGAPKQRGWHLTSGFHAKLPWPFETVRRFPARRVLTTHIGYEAEPTDRKPTVILWTVPHFRAEDQFLVPSKSNASRESDGSAVVPVNLVTMNVPIEYRITNLQSYAYSCADPDAVLRQLAYQALTREASGQDLFDLLGANRLVAAQHLKDSIQDSARSHNLGIEIISVALAGVHPPVAVAPAFQSVVGAMEQREASILQARAYTNQVLPVARADAQLTRVEADAYRYRREQVAKAESQQFTSRLIAYKKAPEVYRMRSYLETLETTLAPVRKYIIDAPASREVIYLNFRNPGFPSVLDLAPTELEDVNL